MLCERCYGTVDTRFFINSMYARTHEHLLRLVSPTRAVAHCGPDTGGLPQWWHLGCWKDHVAELKKAAS